MQLFPPGTELRKRIPKQTLYGKMPLTPVLKRCIAEQIKSIIWSHKLSAETLRISPGEKVDEVQVVEIALSGWDLNRDVIRRLETIIPYRILFLLEHDGLYQACISYRETNATGNTKVRFTFRTPGWCSRDDLPCRLSGLTMDSVYEHLVRQIAGDTLSPAAPTESLADSIRRADARQRIERQITTLQNKIHREKQLNRQMKLHQQVKSLQSQLYTL